MLSLSIQNETKRTSFKWYLFTPKRNSWYFLNIFKKWLILAPEILKLYQKTLPHTVSNKNWDNFFWMYSCLKTPLFNFFGDSQKNPETNPPSPNFNVVCWSDCIWVDNSCHSGSLYLRQNIELGRGCCTLSNVLKIFTDFDHVSIYFVTDCSFFAFNIPLIFALQQ